MRSNDINEEKIQTPEEVKQSRSKYRSNDYDQQENQSKYRSNDYDQQENQSRYRSNDYDRQESQSKPEPVNNNPDTVSNVEPAKKKSYSSSIIIAVTALVIGAVAGGVVFGQGKKDTPPPEESIVTEETFEEANTEEETTKKQTTAKQTTAKKTTAKQTTAKKTTKTKKTTTTVAAETDVPETTKAQPAGAAVEETTPSVTEQIPVAVNTVDPAQYNQPGNTPSYTPQQNEVVNNQPDPPPAEVTPEPNNPTEEKKFDDRNMCEDPSNWFNWTYEEMGAKSSFDMFGNGFTVNVEDGGVDDEGYFYYWWIMGRYDNLTLEKDAIYCLEFDYSASVDMYFSVEVKENYEPYYDYFYQKMRISPEKKHFKQSFVMSDYDDNTCIGFNCAYSYYNNYSVTIENLSLRRIE